MPRIPQVTRTIETTTVTAVCLDLTEQKPYEIVYILSGRFKSPAQIQKALEKELNDETHRVVHVKESTEATALYGMTEQEFIKYAKPLPPRKY